MAHRKSLPADSTKCPNVGGRPVHPAIVATEALVEALAAIDCDYEALEHIAQATLAIARMAHARAERLRSAVRPEIAIGYRAAEDIVAMRIAA